MKKIVTVLLLLLIVIGCTTDNDLQESTPANDLQETSKEIVASKISSNGSINVGGRTIWPNTTTSRSTKTTNCTTTLTIKYKDNVSYKTKLDLRNANYGLFTIISVVKTPCSNIEVWTLCFNTTKLPGGLPTRSRPGDIDDLGYEGTDIDGKGSGKSWTVLQNSAKRLKWNWNGSCSNFYQPRTTTSSSRTTPARPRGYNRGQNGQDGRGNFY